MNPVQNNPFQSEIDLLIPSMTVLDLGLQEDLLFGMLVNAVAAPLNIEDSEFDDVILSNYLPPSIPVATLMMIPESSALLGLVIDNSMTIINLYKATIGIRAEKNSQLYGKQIRGQHIMNDRVKLAYCVIVSQAFGATWYLLFPDQQRTKQVQHILTYLQIRLNKSVDDNQIFTTECIREFIYFDANFDRSLNKSEIKSLMKKMGVDYHQPEVKRLLDYAIAEDSRLYASQRDTSMEKVKGIFHRQGLSIESYTRFVQILQCRSQFYPVFAKYASLLDEPAIVNFAIQGIVLDFVEAYHPKKQVELDYQKCLTPEMTEKQFKTFLQMEQKMHSSLIDLITPKVFMKRETQMKYEKISFFQFCRFISSPTNNSVYNSAVEKSNRKEHNWLDGNYPLPNYYVLSSHNTYLTGNQITSVSSAKIYYLNLQEGVRCLELDIHDSWNGPVIKHGFTFTAEITFESAIVQIANFSAFHPNHTPIILSFENRCKLQRSHSLIQIAVEKHMGSKVYLIHDDISYRDFPTLNDLRGKIIIQGTGDFNFLYPKLRDSVTKSQKGTIGLNQPSMLVVDLVTSKVLLEHKDFFHSQLALGPTSFLSKKTIFKIKVLQMKKMKQDQAELLEKAYDEINKQIIQMQPEHLISTAEERKYLKPGKTLVSYYSLLVSEVDNSNAAFQMGNISEPNTMKMLKISGKFDELVQYCSKRFVRIYPAGLRIMSGNYDPIPMLEFGAQLVSLNTQNRDVYDTVMRGQFVESGNCGYLLKPEHLRDEKHRLKASLQRQFSVSSRKIQFTFIFLMCHNMKPYLPEDADEKTWVQCCFAGCGHDNAKNPYFEDPVKISRRFESKTFFTKLRMSRKLHEINSTHMRSHRQLRMNHEKHLQKYPTVRFHTTNLMFANIFISVPRCGQVAVPLRQVQPGYRSVTVSGSGSVCFYVKIREQQKLD